MPGTRGRNAKATGFLQSAWAAEGVGCLHAGSLGQRAATRGAGGSDDSKVFETLVSSKKTDGDKVSWDTGGTQTCFYGSGKDAEVTATALALHALLLRGGNHDATEGALKFFAASKDPSGNFGSTQATIWALRALLLAATKGSEGAVGALGVSVDGAAVQTLNLTADQSDVMTTVDLSTLATAGSHDVSVNFAGKGKVASTPSASTTCPGARCRAATGRRSPSTCRTTRPRST